MKTRKQGNAIVLNVPVKFGIGENLEYVAIQDADDPRVITYVPKLPNIFEEALANNETIEVGEGFPENDQSVGAELLNG